MSKKTMIKEYTEMIARLRLELNVLRTLTLFLSVLTYLPFIAVYSVCFVWMQVDRRPGKHV